MSDTPLPVYVDARKAFGLDASLQGTISLDKLPRVAACSVDQQGGQGEVSARFSFTIDSAGRRRIRGSAATRLMLTCQRCLEPVATDLEEDFDLVLVDSEDAARLLDKEFEPWISEDNRIVLADLLDEQLLLAMPIVSAHEGDSCGQPPIMSSPEPEGELQAGQAQQDRPNPFAVLADLKIKSE